MINNKLIIWFTGLPCSGKTSLSKILYNYILKKNNKVILFDGDVLRNGINSDLGFCSKDRTENLRRTIELSKIFISENYNVIVSTITPRDNQRKMIKDNLSKNIKIIYLQCSLEKCIERDVKGMYKKAINGEIKNFTGINDKYEIPIDPDLIINTDTQTLDESSKELIKYLENFK